MAEVFDHLLSDISNENLDISKLFPKCQTHRVSNDVNQNKVSEEKLSSVTNNESDINTPNKAVNHFNHGSENCESPLSVSDMSETSSLGRTKEIKDNSNKNGNIEESLYTNTYEQYDHSFTVEMKKQHSPCDDQDKVIYDAHLDIGYHVDAIPEFSMRDSRLQIAGGRELFSKTCRRPSRRHHSDEVVYHPPRDFHAHTDYKRRSGEIYYDENLTNYDYRMHSGYEDKLLSQLGNKNILPQSAPKAEVGDSPVNSCNGIHVLRTSSNSGKVFQPVSEQTQEHTLSSGHLVYEAPIHNAEVIYDDIGELVTHQKIERRNSLLDVRGPQNEILGSMEIYTESVTSDANENSESISFHNKTRSRVYSHDISAFEPYQHLSLENETCERSHPSQKIDDEDQNYEEEMDTKSEPSFPVKQGVVRVIGNLPIAEYEGSPRRYGPRPGHPERIIKDGCKHCIDDRDNDDELSKSDMLNKVTRQSPQSMLTWLQNQSSESENQEILENDHMNHNEEMYSCHCQEPDMNTVCNHPKHENNCVKQHGLKETVSESDFNELEYKLYCVNTGNSYIGSRLAHFLGSNNHDSPKKVDVNCGVMTTQSNDIFSDQVISENDVSIYVPTEQEELLHKRVLQHTGAMEIVEPDHESLSNYTEDLGETEMGEQVDHTRNFTLSPETTECDSNDVESEVSFEGSLNSSGRLPSSMPILEDGLSSGQSSDREDMEGCNTNGDIVDESENQTLLLMKKQISEIEQEIAKRPQKLDVIKKPRKDQEEHFHQRPTVAHTPLQDVDLSYFDSLAQKQVELSPSLTAYSQEYSEEPIMENDRYKREMVSEAIREIKKAIQHSKSVQLKNTPSGKTEGVNQPVWVPRLSHSNSGQHDGQEPHTEHGIEEEECDTDQETERLLGAQCTEDGERNLDKNQEISMERKNTSKEVLIHEPAVLIEGVLFRARYLGSTQLVCEGQPTKATRMMQAEEAVSRIKAPEGETQPNTEVDLFISTEKIMVLNTDLKEIMMDHSLRTISYIADIGDLVVLMARRRILNNPEELGDSKLKRMPKMICHVFESDEAQFIAQSIGQAFQVAYMEFLKANGIEDSSFVKEMDYQEVLNSQEIFGNELEMFSKKEKQKEVVVPKQKGEILGMVIVESGWGSMLPTVVIANMAHNGPGARCGQLNIGDQIIAINGISLVGLPLSTCQNYIKNTKNQTVVKLTVVPCAPVVEVRIKRPDTKYQLGFSVQNGVICSLLRGGIAERGGVRVGHRIIEINGQSVVAVPHEKIVHLLATSIGEIHMKTMPTSMFRLLTGQDTPVYI